MLKPPTASQTAFLKKHSLPIPDTREKAARVIERFLVQRNAIEPEDVAYMQMEAERWQ